MNKRLLTLAALAAMLVASAGANAQTLENIRVRLPNGQVLSLNSPNEYAWHEDPRLSGYTRYYYEPQERVYVVYNNNGPATGHYLHHKKQHPQKVVYIQRPAPMPPQHHDDRRDYIDHNDNNRHGGPGRH